MLQRPARSSYLEHFFFHRAMLIDEKAHYMYMHFKVTATVAVFVASYMHQCSMQILRKGFNIFFISFIDFSHIV